MHIVSTNFAKTLVWKHEYDVKEIVTSQTAHTKYKWPPCHSMKPAPMKNFCERHCSCGNAKRSLQNPAIEQRNSKITSLNQASCCNLSLFSAFYKTVETGAVFDMDGFATSWLCSKDTAHVTLLSVGDNWNCPVDVSASPVPTCYHIENQVTFELRHTPLILKIK